MTEIPMRCHGAAIVIVRGDGNDAEFLALKRTRPPAAKQIARRVCDHFVAQQPIVSLRIDL